MDNVVSFFTLFLSNSISHMQPAIANYSMSFTLFREIGFFDTNPDAMYDDFHTSHKAMWKKKGNL